MAGSSPQRIENTVGKGEIVRNEQFPLSPQCLKTTSIHGRHVKNHGLFGKGLIWLERFMY